MCDQEEDYPLTKSQPYLINNFGNFLIKFFPSLTFRLSIWDVLLLRGRKIC